MKHFKFLGLLVTTAVALMVFAASAMATSVTTTTGGAAATPTIHMVNEGGHIKIANPIAKIECSSTIEGAVETHGTGLPSSGNFSSLTFSGCTNSWHVTTSFNGSFNIYWTSGHNGTFESSGMVLSTTRFGITCVYQTENTVLGTLTGGATATLHLEALLPLNIALSSQLCGSGSAKMEGNYVTTGALYVAS